MFTPYNSLDPKTKALAELDFTALYPNDSLAIKSISPSGFNFTEAGLKQLALAVCVRLEMPADDLKPDEIIYDLATRSLAHYENFYKGLTSKMSRLVPQSIYVDFDNWADGSGYSKKVPTVEIVQVNHDHPLIIQGRAQLSAWVYFDYHKEGVFVSYDEDFVTEVDPKHFNFTTIQKINLNLKP